MPRPVLIILEKILALPCDDQNVKFPCAQQKSFVRVGVFLQDKKRDVQTEASPLVVHVCGGFECLKLLTSLFLFVKETEEKLEQPDFSFFLQYKIEKMVLLIQKLNLSVWHNDPLGRNSFLGEIEVDLASWDWSNRKLNWYPLKPRVSVSQLQFCFLAQL